VVEGIHFINTGSVGRPKDGDWRACYVLLYMDGVSEPEVEFVRVEYDLERAMNGIKESELPDDFASYLQTGGNPIQIAADNA
jgi:diadenosine tetraphosphatase ApaH/serine/threonine PP2A family protein phosphatase